MKVPGSEDTPANGAITARMIQLLILTIIALVPTVATAITAIQTASNREAITRLSALQSMLDIGQRELILNQKVIMEQEKQLIERHDEFMRAALAEHRKTQDLIKATCKVKDNAPE